MHAYTVDTVQTAMTWALQTWPPVLPQEKIRINIHDNNNNSGNVDLK